MQDNEQGTENGNCPFCKGSGTMITLKTTAWTRYVYGDDRELEYAVPCTYCNGHDEMRTKEVKVRSCIPKMYESVSIDDFDWSRYPKNDGIEIRKNYVRGWLIDYGSIFKKSGHGLYIHSKAKGAGKTMLSCCVANSLMAQYRAVVKFVPAYAILDMKAHPDKFYERYGSDAIKTITECEVLIIDDLGQKLTGQEWFEDVLFQIVNERMERRLPTIYTSNFALNDLPYNDRIVDRINAMTQVIELPDVCVRKDVAKDEKRVEREQMKLGEN